MGVTPARVNRVTGEIFLNARVWNRLPDGFKKFILAHEEGHYFLQTTNEIEADNYAFEKLAGTFENSLKTCVSTLADVLPFTNDSHTLRLLNIYRRALKWQAEKYGDEQTITELKRIEKEFENLKNNTFMMDFTGSQYEFRGYGDKNFMPSVGKMFRYIPIDSDVSNQSISAPAAVGPELKSSNNATVQSLQRNEQLGQKVSLSEIPDYSISISPFDFGNIDFKEMLIGGLAILVFILLITK